MIRTGFGGIVWYSTVKYSIVAIVRAVRNNTVSCSSIWGAFLVYGLAKLYKVTVSVQVLAVGNLTVPPTRSGAKTNWGGPNAISPNEPLGSSLN